MSHKGKITSLFCLSVCKQLSMTDSNNRSTIRNTNNYNTHQKHLHKVAKSIFSTFWGYCKVIIGIKNTFWANLHL